MFSFFLSTAGAILSAYFITEKTESDSTPSVKLLLFLTYLILIPTGILLVVGLSGLIHPEMVSACSLLLAIGLFCFRKKAIKNDNLTLSSDTKNLPHMSKWTLVFVAFSGVSLLLIFFQSLGPIHYVGDDLSYHPSTIAKWTIDGTLHTFNYQYQAYYPLHAELFALWFTVPFKTDSMTGLVGMMYLLLLCSGVYVLSRQLTNWRTDSESYIWAILSLILTTLVIKESTLKIVANDMAAPATMVAAFAIISSRKKEKYIIPIALLTGFSVASKVTFSIPAIFLTIYIFFHFRETLERKKIILLLLSFVFLAAIFGGFWYIRNWVLTGNPLFPFETGPFSGPFKSESLERTKLLWWITNGNVRLWVHTLGHGMNWPLGNGILSFAGFTFAIYHLISSNKKDTMIILLIVVIFVFVLCHPILPFSGTDNSKTAGLRIDKRFLILPFTLGLTLLPLVSKIRNNRFHHILLSIIVFVIFSSFFKIILLNSKFQIFFFCLFLIGTSLLLYKKIKNHIFSFQFSIPIILIILTLLLAIMSPKITELNNQAIFTGKSIPQREFGQLLSGLELLQENSKIAWAGEAKHTYYLAYGREWQFDVKPFSLENQQSITPVHESYINGEGTGSVHSLSNFDYLILTTFPKNTPLEVDAQLNGYSNLELVYSNRSNRLYKIIK